MEIRKEDDLWKTEDSPNWTKALPVRCAAKKLKNWDIPQETIALTVLVPFILTLIPGTEPVNALVYWNRLVSR